MAKHPGIPRVKELMPTLNRSNLPDTFVPDTFIPDTFTPDTYTPDTIIVTKPDTFVACAIPDTRTL